MPTPIPAGEFPKCLQSMIEDSKRAVANWDPNEDQDDPLTRHGRDWAVRLSRGEFDDHVYWECVADDCEEAGDWDGALLAYSKIIDLPEVSGMTYVKACSSMGAIHSLLGNDGAALASYRLASENSEDDSCILWRHHVARQVSQLLHMGHFRRARKLIRRGLVSHDGEFVDYLGTARLLISSAQCDLASRKSADAAQSLQLAWEWLDALVQSYGDASNWLQTATGIHFVYATWWAAEAKRRRLADKGDSEIEAFNHAIAKVRLCFDPGGYQRPWHDFTLMKLLLHIADAYDRYGKASEAAAPRAEAEEIFTRRRFPETAKKIDQVSRQSKLSKSFWNLLSMAHFKRK